MSRDGFAWQACHGVRHLGHPADLDPYQAVCMYCSRRICACVGCTLAWVSQLLFFRGCAFVWASDLHTDSCDPAGES